MFHPYTEQQGARVIRLGLRAGGTWLVHMGIFAALLWLSGRMSEKPLAAEKPKESPPARVKPIPVLPPEDLDTRCSWPGDDDVIPFGPQMTPPEFISGEKLQHTREALEARVSGSIIAKCIITCEGKVKDCRMIKSLPYMEQAALTALESRRYRPVRYGGRPVSVSFLFHIRLEPP
jgi:TonB-like protein